MGSAVQRLRAILVRNWGKLGQDEQAQMTAQAQGDGMLALLEAIEKGTPDG